MGEESGQDYMANSTFSDSWIDLGKALTFLGLQFPHLSSQVFNLTQR
jgi:hypothetical protein